MTAQEKLLNKVRAQVGYMGKKTNAQLDDFTANQGGKFNKFARDLDALGDFYNGRKNGYDWCDIFVDWCFVNTFGREIAQKMLYQPNKSLGAGTGYSLGYYKSNGRLFTTPQPGDQIFFGDSKSTWHTGIVTKIDNNYISTVEGNAGSPSAVRSCRYPKNYRYIKGFGRPNWSLVSNNQEEEDEDMTTEKFDQMMKEWLTNKAKEEAGWGKENLDWAKNNGIMQGDEAGRMMPNKFCTRLEVVTMLKRLAEKLGLK